eukprot:2170286-Amphidinium_carterae.1
MVDSALDNHSRSFGSSFSVLRYILLGFKDCGQAPKNCTPNRGANGERARKLAKFIDDSQVLT